MPEAVNIEIGDSPQHVSTGTENLLMHEAVKEGDLKGLKQLLTKEDPTKLDEKGRTPLHWACCYGNDNTDAQTKAVEMVKEILKSRKDKLCLELLDRADKKGRTALQLAEKNDNALVIKELLNSGASPFSPTCDNKENNIMHQIYLQSSPLLTSAFDESVKVEYRDENAGKLKWTFDFVTITGFPKPVGESSFPSPETEWLNQCSNLGSEKKKDVFMHPVVRMFLHLKCKKIRLLFWLSVLYHIAWLFLYAYFNVDLYLAHCPFTAPSERNDTDSQVAIVESNFTQQRNKSMDSNKALDITGVITYCDLWDHYTRLNSELWLLFVMTVTISVKEVYEIFSSPTLLDYFKQLENIGQWTVVVIVFLASIPIFRVDGNWGVGIYEWQYQASSFGILLACFLTLSQIGKIPRFGIYILILAKVVKSFVMFMITFATILAAFMISFQILMPEKAEFRDNPWGFVRVLVMMTGEVNYDDLFHSDEGNVQLPFPISTKFLFAAFIAIVTIILFNLLIGLTVSDIQGLQSGAELNSISVQVKEIYYMEKFMASGSFQAVLGCIGKKHWIEHFRVTRIRQNAPETKTARTGLCHNGVVVQSTGIDATIAQDRIPSVATGPAEIEVHGEKIPKQFLSELEKLVWRKEFILRKEGEGSKSKAMPTRLMNSIKPKFRGLGLNMRNGPRNK